MAITQVSASASTNLDQATDTVINTMTATPGAGTYVAIYSMTVVSNAAPVDADVLFFSLYGAGSQVSGTERRYIEDDSFPSTEHMVAVAAVITVADGQAIDARARVSATGRPFSATFRCLTLLPVASGDVTQIVDTADDTLASATYTVLDSMTSTPPAGDYLLLFGTSIEMDTDADLAAVAVHVGGTILQHSERTAHREQSYNQYGTPTFIACKVSPNGSQAVDVRWQRQAGSGTLTARHRMLTLVKVASGDLLETSGTTDDTDVSTTPVVVDNLTLTTPAADDWVAVFSASDHQVTGGTLFTYGIYVGASLVAASERDNFHEGSLDAADVWIATHSLVAPNGAQNVDVRWNGNDTGSRIIRERTLVLVREAAAAVTENIRAKFRRQPRAEVF